MKSKLYSFLNEHHAFKQFMESCAQHIPSRDVDEFIDRELSSNNGLRIFEKAFVWEDTRRGKKYWSQLNKEWKASL